jgi:hypothetical protein
LGPSFLFRISESLPFGSLALGKLEAVEMLTSKKGLKALKDQRRRPEGVNESQSKFFTEI